MNATAIMRPTDAELFPIACDSINKGYAGVPVLRNLTLAIPRGAVLGLIGRNGAGKTTLIRILLGLLAPDSGTASLLGEPALELSDRTKMRLGYVPQQPDALAWMNVGDMLSFVGGFYPGWDHDYVAEALLRWRIPPSRVLSRLSPGERERVAVIRALAVQPHVLVLDEPAAAFDPVARRDLLRDIALRAADHGTTVLFSTHIVSDLERVASHVCFLYEGEIVLNSGMDDLKDTHARLILDESTAVRFPQSLPGEISRRRRPDGCVSIVLSRGVGAQWPSIVVSAGASLDVLSLEDLFIEVSE
jgi:ABC-2 type transport system ATP-binding protein